MTGPDRDMTLIEHLTHRVGVNVTSLARDPFVVGAHAAKANWRAWRDSGVEGERAAVIELDRYPGERDEDEDSARGDMADWESARVYGR